MSPCARFALLAGLALCQASSAATVSVTSTSIVLVRPEPVEGIARTSAPLVELVQLTAREMELGPAEDIRLQLVAFGRWDPLGMMREDAGADLQLAFVEGRMLDRKIHLRAGRQLVFNGLAPRVLHLDGAMVDYRFARAFGVRAYGGAPVAPAFGTRQADAQVGARAYYAPGFRSEVGASYTYSWLGQVQARNDLGVDGRWAPSTDWNVNGQVVWSLAEGRLVDADLSPRWRPLSNLDLWATVRRTAPDLWLPRTSILSVFSEEQRDELGGGVYYQPLSRLGLNLEARALRLESGNGLDGNLRAVVNAGPSTLVTGQARLLQIPVNGFFQTRVSVLHRLGSKLTVSADADVYFLEEAINEDTRSYTGTGSLAWSFAQGWRATLSGIATSNPTFSSRFDLLAKVSYEFGSPRPAGAQAR